MIFGIGTDIVQISRIQENLDRYGDSFAKRILSAAELADYQAAAFPAHFVARRFAAKEALVKAIGTGFARGVSFHDIIVTHNEAGKPMFRLEGRVAELREEMGIGEDFVSISDERAYAVAFVTLLKASATS